MSDFWNLFNPRRKEEEEENVNANISSSRSSELFSRFNPAERSAALERDETPAFQRNFMDRIFAPFEAPQQTLFALTREIAEDGFQIGDVWRAISHGMDYFNPFGDTERIHASKIRDIFLGATDEEQRSWKTTGTELAFSIFFDPLWLLPPIAAARKAGAISSTVAGAASRIVNPGALLFDAAKETFNRGVRPAARNIAKRLGKESEYLNLSTRITQNLFNRFAGVDSQARELFGKYEIAVRKWAGEGAQAIEEVSKLGPPKVRQLLARAVESDAVYNRHILNKTLTKAQRKEYDSLVKELLDLGVDMDLWWQGYQKVQFVEMGLMDDLMKLGLVTNREHAELYGRHLRKYYTAFDNPLAALERVETLLSDPAIAGKYAKDFKVFDQQEMAKSLQLAARELDASMATLGTRTALGFNPDVGRAAKYFTLTPEGARRFNPDAFLADFSQYIRRHPEASVAEASQFVQQVMLEGSAVPASFMATIQNYLSSARATTSGLLSWRDKFLEAGNMATVTFRPYRSNMEVLAKRENIPEIIRREVLGEVTDAAPRIAKGVSITARQMELTRMLDELSGARRLSGELAAVGDRVRRGTSSLDDLTEVVRRELPNLTDQEVNRMARRIQSGDIAETDVLWKEGGVLASVNRTEQNIVQMSVSEHLGSMSGMWTRPGIKLHLEQYARAAGAIDHSDKARGIADFMLNMMEEVTGHFKFLKIVSDAGANFRDTVGSLMQLDITTGLPFDLVRLNKSLQIAQQSLRGQRNFYTDVAESIGYPLMSTGFTATELGRIARVADARRLAWNPKQWQDNGQSIFQTVGDAFANVRAKAAHLYQTRENMFRTYVFSSSYDELAQRAARAGREITPEMQRNFARQAAAKTDQALFNYADIPYAAEWARRYGVAPFITFPIKSTSQLVSALFERPHRVLRYERGLNSWNEHHAGGPEEFARELAALPDHKREALVVRLPGEDRDGNPLYLDLSYFLPWYAIKDLAEDVSFATQTAAGTLFGGELEFGDEGQRRRLVGDMGMRSSIISPILFQLYDAFRHGRDGLGRPLWQETDGFDRRMMALGRYMYQFMTPPTAPGGTTADSVGRAMLAMARTSPEPMNWVELLAPVMRGPWTDESDILDRYGRRPRSRATTGRELEGHSTEASTLLGGGLGLFFNVTTSDPVRQTQQELTQASLSNNEIQRQIARVRSNYNLTPEQKVEEIRRLQRLYQQNRATTTARVQAMF
jgi:hypothetical protein